MRLKIRNEDVAEIITILKGDLSERENDAARAGMCLRYDFVEQRKILINKLVEALKLDVQQKDGE